MNQNFDAREFIMRVMKYVAEGLIVAVAAFVIPGKKLSIEEVITIGVIAAATFSVLDLFSPSIGSTARAGAGLGIGVNLVGGLNPGPLLK